MAIIGIISTVLASTAFTIGTTAVTWGTIISVVTNGIIFGGSIVSACLSKKRSDFSSLSNAYQGIKQTQTNQDLPIPLLYGTCKLAGNRIWQDENNTTTVKRIVAFAEGEICEFSDIRLNDIPINEISGAEVRKYYGTTDQEVDSIVGGSNQSERAEKIGSLKGVAYLAISAPRSQKVDINYNLTAIVKGKKIRVYSDPYNYEVKYSENPAWVIFDFLTCYNGLGICLNKEGNIDENLVNELIDLNSFIESAEYCDELVNEQPRFTFNMIFDAQTSARTLLDEIYKCCQGGLFINNGKLQFKVDKPSYVSKVFTQEDIIKGSEIFQTIPKEEHYDILKCTYISPKHEWQQVEASAEVPEYKSDLPIEHSVKIFSCTNFEQASRLAWYYVNSKRIQPYFGSFKTTYKAYDLEVGDVILIDSILMGLEKYKVKVNSVTDHGNGLFTIDWRTYDERLYSDELGSLEPKILISSIKDIATYPDDVSNFNVVQSTNLFNFVWQENQDSTNTYEIRMGDNWQTGTIVKSNIFENKHSIEIPSNGLFKFWIKAFNGYNYSKNATLDVINVDSIPSVNEILKYNLLENIPEEINENLKVYQNTIKLKEKEIFWKTTNSKWENNSGYYQTGGFWGGKTLVNSGVYESNTIDIGADLECIVTFTCNYFSSDKQNNVLLEWSYSSDGEIYTPWKIANQGKYQLRYCKLRATLNSYNGVQIVLTNLGVSIDVPDKDLDIETEITDPQGLRIDYNFIKPPSIVATVNDNNDAYVVITEKTNKYAILKAYKNSGELTTGKISLRAKGY